MEVEERVCILKFTKCRACIAIYHNCWNSSISIGKSLFLFWHFEIKHRIFRKQRISSRMSRICFLHIYKTFHHFSHFGKHVCNFQYRKTIWFCHWPCDFDVIYSFWAVWKRPPIHVSRDRTMHLKIVGPIEFGRLFVGRFSIIFFSFFFFHYCVSVLFDKRLSTHTHTYTHQEILPIEW